MSVAGATAALAGLGFIVESAYDYALGVSIQFLSPAFYVVSGGNFLLASLALIMRWCQANTPLLSVGAALVGLVMLASHRWKWRARKAPYALLVSGFVIVGFGNLIFLELPSVDLANFWGTNGLVNAAFGPLLPTANSTQRRSLAMVRTLVCAHFPEDQYSSNMWQACESRDVTQARGRLDNAVFECIALSVAEIAIFFLMRRSYGSSEGSQVGRLAMASLLAVNLLSVPYFFGKTLRFTRGTLVTVFYSSEDNTSEGSDKAHRVLHENGIVVSENTDELVFLSEADFNFLYLPRSRVVEVRTIKPADMLEDLVSSSLQPPTGTTPPPPMPAGKGQNK